MDTSKTSNPSGNSGEADDLIEEMARMMAAGAKDKSAGDKRQAPLRTAPAPQPAATAGSQAGQGAVAPTLARSAPAGNRAPAPQNPATPTPAPTQAIPAHTPLTNPEPATGAPSRPAFNFSPALGGSVQGNAGQGSAGGQTPTPKPANPAFSGLNRPASTAPASTAPASPAPAPGSTQAPAQQAPAASAAPAGGTAPSSPFKFELGGNGANPAPPAQPVTANPAPGASSAPPAQPVAGGGSAPAAPFSSPARSPSPGTPEAFSAAARAEPLNDPIADLIRSQSQAEPAPAPQQQNPANPAQSAATNTAASAPQSGRAAASDNFNVPPVFGLGGQPSEPLPVAPQKAAPPVSSRPDALDEIENLIGNAVHVDFPQDATSPGDASAQNAVEKPPQAAPQVTQAPGRHPQSAQIAAPQPGTQNNVDAAEAAIFQAMGGTNALPQDATGPDLQPAAEPELAPEALLAGASYEEQKPGRSRYLIPAVAIVLLAGAAGGGYFLLNSGTPDGEAPVLFADASPSKETPVNPEPDNGDQSVIFDGLEGNAVPESEQQLLSRDQTDGATGNQVRQVITADTTQEGLANRRVRTVTVRPDGTIINGDDAVAGGELLPVAQPNLPDLPQGAVNTQLADTIVAALPESPDLTATTTTALPLSSSATTFSVDGASVPFPRARLTDLERQNRVAVNRVAQTSSPIAQTPVALGSTNTPAPSNTPGAVDLIATIAAEAVNTPPATIPDTTTTTAATPAPVAPLQPVTNPTSFVQMASLRRQDVAEETATSLQSRYASALRGGQLTVKRVDLGDRGVFYRVLLPTASLSEASSVCRAIQNAGGDCFPRNN